MANRNYKRIERVIKSFSKNVEAEGSGGGELEDNKTVSPSTETISVKPDEGYDGLKQVTVEAVTSTIDENIKPENIKRGVSILDVEGTFETPIQASKSVTPSAESQEVEPDEGYEGLAKVVVASAPLMSSSATPTTSSQTFTPTGGALGFDSFTVQAVDPSQYYKPETSVSVSPSTVSQTITPSGNEVFNVVNVSAVTSAIDQNIQPSNIVSGVSILGVNGTYSVPLQSKSVNLTTSSATFTPDNGYSGFSQITVSAKLMSSTVTPATTTQTVTPASGFVGFSRVRVNAVPTQTSWIYPSKAEWSGQTDTIYPDSGYYFSYVYVSRVDSSIDSNIQPSNIKKDVNILGVTGILEGGGIEEVSELPSSPTEGAVYELLDKSLSPTTFDMASYNLDRAKAVKIGDYIYIVAPATNDIYKYNPSTEEITVDGSLPPTINRYFYYAGVEAIGNNIYIFGGDGQSGGDAHGDIFIYDITTHTYQSLPSELTYAKCSMATVVYNGKIWLFGGREGTTGSVVNAVQKFDPSTNTLSYIGSLTDSKSDMACCTDGTYIYLIGGRDYMGSANINCTKIEISSNETSISEMPYASLTNAVYGASAVWYQDTIYVIGNNSSMFMDGGPVWKLNKDTMTWDHVIYTNSDPMSPFPSYYYYNSSVIFGDYIYSLGGVSDGVMYQNNVIYKISNSIIGMYTNLDGVWYNITDPSGIVEVSELPTVGKEDKIYRVIETELSDEGNYTTSSDYNFTDACSIKFGNYIYFFNVRDNMAMGPVDLKYNPETKTFTQLDRSLVPHTFNKCAVVGNYIYLFNIEYSGTGSGRPIYKFDPSTDTYIQTNSSISINMQPQTTVCYPMGTDIVIVSAFSITTATVYDTINDFVSPEMVKFDDATTFNSMYYCASCVYGDSIYIFGLKYYGMSGYEYYTLKFTSGNFSSEMYTYKFKAELIQVSENIGVSNSCGIIGNKAYIFGGYKDDGMYYSASDAIYEFNLETNSLSLNPLTLPEECCSTFTVSLNATTLYTMAEKTLTGNPPMESTLRAIYTFSSTVESDYVYRNSAWLDINNGGGSGGVQVDKVSNLSASGTVLSWTAPDTTSISQYNPQLAYAISVDGTTVTTTSQTSIDIAQYLGGGSNTVAVTVVLTYTDTKNETITISGRAEITEVEILDLSGSSSQIYKTRGILGAVAEVISMYSSFPVYVIYGGQEYDSMTASYILNSSMFSIRDEGISPVGSIYSAPRFDNVRIDGNYMLTDQNLYYINYSFYGDNYVSFSAMSIGYSNPTYFPTLATIQKSYEDYLYAFGGNEVNPGTGSTNITDFIYVGASLHYNNPTFASIGTLMPEGRCMAEIFTVSSRSGMSMDYYNGYIVGGFSSVGSTPTDMVRASRIFKYNFLTDTFYSDFTNIIPSNIQVPYGIEDNSRMNTYKVTIQGKDYLMGKDTTDNQIKLFEFDYTTENLKSSGISLTNQNVKAIDTLYTSWYTRYGIAIYENSSTGNLYYEKLIANKMSKTMINDNFFSTITTVPNWGLTSIKDNHMYTIGACYNMGTMDYKALDINLSTGACSELPMVVSPLTAGTSIVQDSNYAYLVNQYVSKVDFTNSSITQIGTISSSDAPHNAVTLMYNGKIYVFGGAYGTNGSWTLSSDVYKIDIANGETQATKLSVSLNTSRFNAVGIISGHYAYIVGGYANTSMPANVAYQIEKFDFENDTFDTLYLNSIPFSITSGTDSLYSEECHDNPVYIIDNKVYVKPYGETPELLYFDQTNEGFAPIGIGEENKIKYIEKNSILFEEAYWNPQIYNCSNSELYAISSEYNMSTMNIQYKLFKYSK